MNKKQTTILIITVFITLLLGIGAGVLFANQTNPKQERAVLEQEMEGQLAEAASQLTE